MSHSTRIRGHFGDESMQVIDGTGRLLLRHLPCSRTAATKYDDVQCCACVGCFGSVSWRVYMISKLNK